MMSSETIFPSSNAVAMGFDQLTPDNVRALEPHFLAHGPPGR